MKNPFQCIVYNPIAWQTAAPAVAAVRAGGSAALSVTYGDSKRLAFLFERAAQQVPRRNLGIRLDVEDLISSQAAWDRAIHTLQPGFLVLCDEGGRFEAKELAAIANSMISQQPVL